MLNKVASRTRLPLHLLRPDRTGQRNHQARGQLFRGGHGMGNGEGTCGSIVGAGIVYGLAVRDQAKAVKGMRQIMEKFQERNGATCRMFVNGTAYIIGRRRKSVPLCSYNDSHAFDLCAIGT